MTRGPLALRSALILPMLATVIFTRLMSSICRGAGFSSTSDSSILHFSRSLRSYTWILNHKTYPPSRTRKIKHLCIIVAGSDRCFDQSCHTCHALCNRKCRVPRHSCSVNSQDAHWITSLAKAQSIPIHTQKDTPEHNHWKSALTGIRTAYHVMRHICIPSL